MGATRRWIWRFGFIRRTRVSDERAVEDIAARAREVLLVSGAGAEVAKPPAASGGGLPPLRFAARLRMRSRGLGAHRSSAGAQDGGIRGDARAGGRVGLCAAQSARARIAAERCAPASRNSRRRTVISRSSKEKLLKLKEAKRELKQLKQEKQALRKSPERKIGQVLLAPYRLPQKLLREVRKRFPKPGKFVEFPRNEYQKWLEQAADEKR